MLNLQIGFPPLVVEVKLEELGQLVRLVDRLLNRRHFVGYFHILAKHSGKCLDVLEARRDDGAPVQQYALHGGANQQWLFAKAPDGYYYIVARHSGKCLDVEGFSSMDAAGVQQYALHGGDNQKWELRTAADGCYNIVAKHSGKALDVEGWNHTDGGTVFQYSLHGGANQCWRVAGVKNA